MFLGQSGCWSNPSLGANIEKFADVGTSNEKTNRITWSISVEFAMNKLPSPASLSFPNTKPLARVLAGIGLGACIAISPAFAASTLTSFTLNTGVTGVSTGTFSVGSSTLSSTGDLAGSGNTFNYASQLFTPSATGSYTFGMSSAPNDTVLILYSGSHNPASPTTNVVALNDDSDGLGAGGVTMGTCGGLAGLCPKMTQSLTGATNYYVVVTTYGAGGSVTLPIGFYVYGEPVGVGGAPPPAALSVLGSSTALGNSPAYGGARIIDDTPALLALFTGAGLSGDQQISGAASQTLPLLTGGSVVAAQDVLRDIGRIVQARMSSNSGMSTGDAFDGDKNFWMKPFGSMADQNDRNGVAGYKANTFGLAIGVDGAVTKALRIGGAFAYAKSDINGQSSIAPQSALVDVYHLLGYGSYSVDDRTEINFQVGIGQNENKGRRQIAFTSSLASSDFSSETANVGVGIGRTYRLSTETSVTPSVRLDYTWIKDKAYSETGAGLLNLNVSGRETDALIVGVDGKVAHQLNAQTTLIGNLGVGYDTINKQSAITSAFAGAPTAAFVTYGIDPSPWLARGGMGGVYKTKSGLEITARYDAEYRESFLNQTASVKARWAF